MVVQVNIFLTMSSRFLTCRRRTAGVALVFSMHGVSLLLSSSLSLAKPTIRTDQVSLDNLKEPDMKKSESTGRMWFYGSVYW